MKVVCPACHSLIGHADINIDALVAKCAACDEVFSFAQSVAETHQTSPARTSDTGRDLEYETPPAVSVHEKDNEIQLNRRWFSWSALPVLGFAAVWDAFLVGWYAMAANVPGGVGTLFFVFPLIHVGVGVGLTYFGLAKVFNRTKIWSDGHKIRVTHGPFKWRKPREVYVSAIRQLYVHQSDVKRRRQPSVGQLFAVHALLEGGGSLPLVEGLTSHFDALFIEQELERFLKLDTAPVRGEYRPAPHEILVGVKRRAPGSLTLVRPSQAGSLSVSNALDSTGVELAESDELGESSS